MTHVEIDRRILELERKLRTTRAILASSIVIAASSVLVGATCSSKDEVLNVGDITAKRVFAEKVFVMDAPPDPESPRHIGAVMTMAGESTNLIFFDPDGEPSVRVGYSEDVQGLSVLNRKKNSDVFIGRVQGIPSVTLFAPSGDPMARMRTNEWGGAFETFDANGVVRVAAGVVEDEGMVWVADPDGKQIGGFPPPTPAAADEP